MIKQRKRKMLWRVFLILPVIVFLLGLIGARSAAAGGELADGLSGSLGNVVRTLFGENTETVDIIILLTLLTLAPSLLIMLTGFTRIIIVISFLRSATGMQQTPPNQVMIGLALFLTMFVMGPVLTAVYDEAYVPYSEGEISTTEFFDAAMGPIRGFMLEQTRRNDIDFFVALSAEETQYQSYEDVPSRILIPAFMISEIKTAFQIGFFIYIPFIVVDMVVASTLMAMGMMMLPPAMISLPFKIMIFVMVDGWQLAMGTLIKTFIPG